MKFGLRNIFVGLLAPIATFALVIGCSESNDGGDSGAEEGNEMSIGGESADPVARGEFLVNVMGCNDCHSAKVMGPKGPEPDPAMLLAGHPADQPLPEHDPNMVGMAPDKWILANMHFTAYVGPWGTSYAANLTPDPTGLGSWTEEQFIKCIREGLYKGMDGSRPLAPPMPWFAYALLPDDDLKAIFAYLHSIPAVSNAVPGYIPPAGGMPGGEAPHAEEPPAEGGEGA